MTFLELIVVLGIFGAISATVLFNYGDFSSNVHLQNLAQDIALQIKKTQTDAISGRIPTLSDTQNQNIDNLVPLDWVPSYGLAFTTTQSDKLPTSPVNQNGRAFVYYFNSYADNDSGLPLIIFQDFFDFEGSSYQGCGSSADSECLEEINITSGDVIDEICFNFVSIDSGEDCTANGGEPGDHAYISFTRPRGNANIMLADTAPEDREANVYLRLTSRQGGHKYITVWQSGYISTR